MTASVTDDKTNKGVRWALSCAGGQCGAISSDVSASGAAINYTAPISQIDDKDVTFTATSVSDPSAVDSMNIVVLKISISATAHTAGVQAGGTVHLLATVTNDATDKGVTWTLACPGDPCGTVSPTAGLSVTYTAPTIQPTNDFAVTFTATSLANPLMSGSGTIIIPGALSTVNVAVTPLASLLPAGVTEQFVATVQGDVLGRGVAWTLSQNGTPCSSACGAVDPATTATDVPTTYASPATLPSGGPVTLTASSLSAPSKVASATITLTSGNVELVPSRVNFGSSFIPKTRTATLTNTGSSTLAIDGMVFTGIQAGAFSQTNTCGTGLSPGASCTITVTFTPHGLGVRSATLSISDSSPDSPQHLSLAGFGIRFL